MAYCPECGHELIVLEPGIDQTLFESPTESGPTDNEVALAAIELAETIIVAETIETLAEEETAQIEALAEAEEVIAEEASEVAIAEIVEEASDDTHDDDESVDDDTAAADEEPVLEEEAPNEVIEVAPPERAEEGADSQEPSQPKQSAFARRHRR